VCGLLCGLSAPRAGVGCGAPRTRHRRSTAGRRAAAALALDAAVDNAKDCIQVLGGIGFTWEHDAHLYLRRALALPSSRGGRLARADGALALAGSRRRWP